MAAEFFGNCQICGREQKAHPHKIAKHGYTVQYGWQSGECYGSNGAPIQTSCDLIARAVERAKEYIKRSQEEITRLNSANPLGDNGTILVVMKVQGIGGSTYNDWCPATVVQNDAGDYEVRNHNSKTVATLRSYNYDTLSDAIKMLAGRRARYLVETIGVAEQSIKEMTARLTNWKPTELRPVTATDRAATAIKVHMVATKFGRKTGVCVASASGAQAYKQTTDDRSKVTCAACLKELARLDDLPRLRAEKAEKERLADIKRAEREIKDYTKYLKNATTEADKLYYARELTEATNRLNELKAAAPAAAQ
jgi:hypothetical protein